MAPNASPSPATSAQIGCAVCGSPDVCIDEVYERGLWRLGECTRCRHRWTEGPFGRGPLRVVRPAHSESAAA
jgi:hypothetical protein